MSMRVLVLGGAGFVGQAVARRLIAEGCQSILASRQVRNVPQGATALQLDALDADALKRAIEAADAVVNCIAGDARTIADSALNLVSAIQQSAGQTQCVVHLSSMAVYGGVEGRVLDDSPFGTELGWYGDAKVRAEGEFRRLSSSVPVKILRPGCIYGPGSTQWTLRIARLLQARRLGDMGAAADGWSNLVHVDDVAAAVAHAVVIGRGEVGVRTYNLAAPDSPRWNEYFIRLSQLLGVNPIKRVPALQLKLDAKLFSVGLKVAQTLASKAGVATAAWPEVMSPSLLRLWQQQIKLEATAVSQQLLPAWTPFESGLHSSVDWLASSLHRRTY